MSVEHQSMNFSGGVNPSAPAHLIGEDEVQSAINVDFGLERGAAMVRRGYSLIGGSPYVQRTIKIYRHYKSGIANSRLFAVQADDVSNSKVLIGSYGGGTYAITGLITGTIGDIGAFASYKDTVLIGFGAGTNNSMHDGTSLLEWFKQAPAAAPSISIGTLTALVVSTNFTVSEGTASGTGTIGIAAGDATTYRVQFDAAVTTTNLNVNGTHTIGDYGVNQLKIGFSDPTKVVRVSLDYSIGGTDFTSYWHTQMTLDDVLNAMPSFQELVESTPEVEDVSVYANVLFAGRVVSRISAVADDFVPWRVPYTDFEFIGQTSTSSGWSNIGACRIIIEATDIIDCSVTELLVYGAEDYPLNDADSGYSWWMTWGKVDNNGVIVSESSPCAISAQYKVQNARATLTATETPTGTAHDLTHRIYYRQGGYLDKAYLIGSATFTTTTFIDTMADVNVLSTGIVLNRNIYNHTNAPGNIIAISEPYQGRVFIGVGNKLMWSLPGKPDVFPLDSYAYVSHSGDEIYALHVTPSGLVIVNRDSVYEISGTVFEGVNQDWTLIRTNSRNGCKSRQASVNSPYGITILDYDGFYLYQPGQGVSQPLQWASEKFADLFRGANATDPAALKGSRIPAFNKPYIQHASVVFGDNRFYIALPTGTSTAPNMVYVFDMLNKTCWWYSPFAGAYPYSMYWDMEDNRLLMGINSGAIHQFETSMTDGVPASGKPWYIRTRAWTTPNDTVLENIQVEYVGELATFAAYYDGGTKTILGTLTSTTKDYITIPLNGTIGNNVVFEVGGTCSSTSPTCVYGIHWDAIVDPPRVKYWRTESEINNYDGEKLWNVAYRDLEFVGTGTVTAVTFIDGSAVMTNTIVSTATGVKSRDIYPFAFPAETYGDVAHTTYTATTNLFKHWKTRYDATNEPSRINYWKSQITSLDENICDGADVDINPNGTVTSIVYVDNTAVGTYTNTGTKRQSYTNALPNETYGRTIYTTYSGTAFKHYNTWFHLRAEPDRWTNFVSDKQSGPETYWKNFNCAVNCLGAALSAIVYVDGSAVGTYTMTGSTNQSYVHALPVDTYGRSIWAVYTSASRFKHYKTWFDGDEEPPKVAIAQAGPFVYPSENYLKTWVAVINPNGTCTGVVYGNAVNGGTRAVLYTNTFTGTNKQTFNIGLEESGAGATSNYSELFVVYTGTNLKHYETNFEVENHPFKKKSWQIIYRKLGGATRLDQARFWTVDFDVDGYGTLTSTWFADGVAVATNTITSTSSDGRNYIDMQPLPPGIRGYEFSQWMTSNSDFSIWKSTLDIIRTGVKGYSRITLSGRPLSEQ